MDRSARQAGHPLGRGLGTSARQETPTDMDVPLNDLRRGFADQERELREAVDAVLTSGWYVLGPQHDAFEREFAAAVGVAHGIGVANGTDALELALLSVGCRAGDEIVTAANAGMYTSTAALK